MSGAFGRARPRGGLTPVRLLVTGGAGFIGSNFIRYLLQEHPEAEVTNFDALIYAGDLENPRL